MLIISLPGTTGISLVVEHALDITSEHHFGLRRMTPGVVDEVVPLALSTWVQLHDGSTTKVAFVSSRASSAHTIKRSTRLGVLGGPGRRHPGYIYLWSCSPKYFDIASPYLTGLAGCADTV